MSSSAGSHRRHACRCLDLSNPDTHCRVQSIFAASLQTCVRIFVVQILEDSAGDFPGGYIWAIFSTKMRRKIWRLNPQKNPVAQKPKSAKKPFCQRPTLKSSFAATYAMQPPCDLQKFAISNETDKKVVPPNVATFTGRQSPSLGCEMKIQVENLHVGPGGVMFNQPRSHNSSTPLTEFRCSYCVPTEARG